MKPTTESAHAIEELAKVVLDQESGDEAWSFEVELTILPDDAKLSVRLEKVNSLTRERVGIIPTESIQTAIATLLGLRITQVDAWNRIKLTAARDNTDSARYQVEIA